MYNKNKTKKTIKLTENLRVCWCVSVIMNFSFIQSNDRMKFSVGFYVLTVWIWIAWHKYALSIQRCQIIHRYIQMDAFYVPFLNVKFFHIARQYKSNTIYFLHTIITFIFLSDNIDDKRIEIFSFSLLKFTTKYVFQNSWNHTVDFFRYEMNSSILFVSSFHTKKERRDDECYMLSTSSNFYLKHIKRNTQTTIHAFLWSFCFTFMKICIWMHDFMA